MPGNAARESARSGLAMLIRTSTAPTARLRERLRRRRCGGNGFIVARNDHNAITHLVVFNFQAHMPRKVAWLAVACGKHPGGAKETARSIAERTAQV